MVEPGFESRCVRDRCTQMTGTRSGGESQVQAVAATMKPRASPREYSIRIDNSGLLLCHQTDQDGPRSTLSTADACALRCMSQHVIHLLGSVNHPPFYQVDAINHQGNAPGCVISQSSEASGSSDSASRAARSASRWAASASASARAAIISDSLRISIDHPVSFAASRTF